MRKFQYRSYRLYRTYFFPSPSLAYNPSIHEQTNRSTSFARKAEEQQSSTGVMDPPEIDPQVLKRDRDKAKERQKTRLGNTGLNKDELVELYRQMLLIRRFEEKSAEVYVAGKIGGFCHLYIGQEAVGVGAISAIRKDDYVLGSYREHGLALAKGMSAAIRDGRALRESYRLFQGQRRLDAHVR